MESPFCKSQRGARGWWGQFGFNCNYLENSHKKSAYSSPTYSFCSACAYVSTPAWPSETLWFTGSAATLFFHLLISTHLKESHVIPGLHAPACQQTLKHLPWTYKKSLSSSNSKEWHKEGAETCTGTLLWIFKILQNAEMPFPFFVCLCARQRYAISVGITWSLGEQRLADSGVSCRCGAGKDVPPLQCGSVFLSACPNFCSYLSEKRVGSVFKLSPNQTPAVVFLCKRSQMQRKKGTACQPECGWREWMKKSRAGKEFLLFLPLRASFLSLFLCSDL